MKGEVASLSDFGPTVSLGIGPHRLAVEWDGYAFKEIDPKTGKILTEGKIDGLVSCDAAKPAAECESSRRMARSGVYSGASDKPGDAQDGMGDRASP